MAKNWQQEQNEREDREREARASREHYESQRKANEDRAKELHKTQGTANEKGQRN
jgi:hypothetical protein